MIASPLTRRAARLVVRRRTSGHSRRSRSASPTTAGTRCSQLSSTRRRFLSRSQSHRVFMTARPASSRTPIASAAVCATSSGSLSDASSTNHTPSLKRSIRSAAACSASRVLPVPPPPIRVSIRFAPSRSLMSASSRSRPMKAVGLTGKLWRLGSIDLMGGNSARRPGAITWKTRSGLSRSRSRCAPRSRRPTPWGSASTARSRVAWVSSTWSPCPVASRRAQR